MRDQEREKAGGSYIYIDEEIERVAGERGPSLAMAASLVNNGNVGWFARGARRSCAAAASTTEGGDGAGSSDDRWRPVGGSW